MDYMEKITDLRAQKGALQAQAEGLMAEGKFDELDPITDQMEAINKQIKSLERVADASRSQAKDAYDGLLHDGQGSNPKDKGDEVKPFANLGEQLKAICNSRKSGVVDERLARVNDAALGANEGTGADGSKAAHYAEIQKFAHDYEARHGSFICRDLIAKMNLPVSTDPTPDARTPEYYQHRACAKLVESAAAMLDAYIAERGLPTAP